jgi:hypothetical protein
MSEPRMFAIVDLDKKSPIGGGEELELFGDMTELDQFTYTMRLAVPEEKRAEIKQKLVDMQKEGKDTQPLIDLLEKHSWDVSFLVDCW